MPANIRFQMANEEIRELQLRTKSRHQFLATEIPETLGEIHCTIF